MFLLLLHQVSEGAVTSLSDSTEQNRPRGAWRWTHEGHSGKEAGACSDGPALLSHGRDAAGETIETEWSQAKATACVTRTVLFKYESSDGVLQGPSKALALTCLGASACLACWSLFQHQTSHFVSNVPLMCLLVKKFCYGNNRHHSIKHLLRKNTLAYVFFLFILHFKCLAWSD